MEGGGPFDFGDGSQDPEDVAEASTTPWRWLPPEDRLWRHPSEVARYGHPESRTPLLASSDDDERRRRFTVTAGVVGVAVVAAAVVATLVLTDSHGAKAGSLSEASATEANLVTTPVITAVPAPLVVRLVSALRPSLVEIEPSGHTATTHMTGIVLPGGQLAITAAAAVANASRVDIVTFRGERRRVRVIGRDTRSGIAVVSTGGDLPAATFADTDVEPGELAITACLCANAPAGADTAEAPATMAVGEIRKVGATVTLDTGTTLIDAIEADTTLGPQSWGGVLLDGHGQVVGILDARQRTAGEASAIFAPSPLAVAVADELAAIHKVEHGWLGVRCEDAPDDGGAQIMAVLPGSPAAMAGMRQGDVVEAVDSHRVESLADLQARLYTTPPGTAVRVALERNGIDMAVTLTLSATPG